MHSRYAFSACNLPSWSMQCLPYCYARNCSRGPWDTCPRPVESLRFSLEVRGAFPSPAPFGSRVKHALVLCSYACTPGVRRALHVPALLGAISFLQRSVGLPGPRSGGHHIRLLTHSDDATCMALFWSRLHAIAPGVRGALRAPALLRAIFFLWRSVGLTLPPLRWVIHLILRLHAHYVTCTAIHSLTHTQVPQGSVGHFTPPPCWAPASFSGGPWGSLPRSAVASIHKILLTQFSHGLAHMYLPQGSVGHFLPPPGWEPSLFPGGPWGHLCPRSAGYHVR